MSYEKFMQMPTYWLIESFVAQNKILKVEWLKAEKLLKNNEHTNCKEYLYKLYTEKSA